MKTYLDCITCSLRQALDAARLATDDPVIHEQVMRHVLEYTRTMDFSQTPPEIAWQFHRWIRQLTGIADPYKTIKQQHNQLALELLDRLEPMVRDSDNPLETAVRLSIAGNIIDLGVKTSITDTDIQETIEHALDAPFAVELLDQLRADAQKAEDILFLTDNAGEIVLDRLLLAQLPTDKITVVVKASPIINDATIEDAEMAGITAMTTVIDNGSDGPGTILRDCSDAFKQRLEKANLVIAKGQAHYETLSDVPKNIYFILKAKCPVVAAHLGCETGQMILKQSDALKSLSLDRKENE